MFGPAALEISRIFCSFVPLTQARKPSKRKLILKCHVAKGEDGGRALDAVPVGIDLGTTNSLIAVRVNLCMFSLKTLLIKSMK